MYSRDKNVERAESLERIAALLDKLTEVVAKDETSKEILASLKEKGAKDVEPAPVSGQRAEEIQSTYSKTRRQGEAGDQLQFNHMRRLNDAFRALGGDMGAFQRTLVSTVNISKRTQDMFNTPGGLSATIETPMSLKAFKNKYIADMGAEYFNKVSPDREWLNKALGRGMDFNTAMREATDRVQSRFDREVSSKYGEYKDAFKATPRAVPLPPSSQPGMGDISNVARIAAITAVVAAPIIMTKLAYASATAQIEGTRDRFGGFNPAIGTALAQYDLNSLTRDMRIAPQVSRTFREMVGSKMELDKVMEPIDILGENLKNRMSTIWNKMSSVLMTPVNWLADKVNKGFDWLDGIGGEQQTIQDLQKKKDWDALAAHPAVIGMNPDQKAAMPEWFRQMVMDNITQSTPIGAFAISIQRADVVPPQRFVP